MGGGPEVRLGRVIGVFGLRGEVRLWLWNRESDLLWGGEFQAVLLSPSGQRRQVVMRLRPGAGKRVLAKVAGVEDRDVARTLVGWELLVRRDQLPEPEEGSWYVHDLLGCRVRTAAGRDLGELVEVHSGQSVDVWEMRGPSGTTFFPLLLENVVRVDVSSAREIVLEDRGVVEDDTTGGSSTR